MTRYLAVVFALLAAQGGFSQRVIDNYAPQHGQLRYGPGQNDVFPYGDKGFTLVLPGDGRPVTGTVVDLEDQRVSAANSVGNQEFGSEAMKKGFALLTISTGVPVDWYFSESSMQFVDSVMHDTFVKYQLPNKNIFFLGIMTSGHRALKYIEYCKSGKSGFHPAVTGVILCECAIDWVRMWYEAQKQVRDHATASNFFEGKLIHYLFDQQFKVTPVQDIGKYIDFSPYSYFDLQMKKPALYVGLAVRAYTFADIRYWFSAQGKGIYDSNYPDMSGFVNEQKLAGNKRAELIVFHSNMVDEIQPRMRRQSTTWDLVDKKELVNWMAARAG